MDEAIINFPAQFAYEPEIENEAKLKACDSFILAGMGGSHLAAGILKTVLADLDLSIHRDYGLPEINKKKQKHELLIAASYSGNTEEVVDFMEKAIENKLNIAAVATGGKLLDIAEQNEIPFIKLPDTGIQPRSALGYATKAIAKLINNGELMDKFRQLKEKIDVKKNQEEGKKLAANLIGKIPVIYSSLKNESVSYNWKIKFNETGKIPAFYNVFPELNHNEMIGFDWNEKSKDLSAKFHFIFLKDSGDHPRIARRMDVCEKLFESKGFPVTAITMFGEEILDKIFNSLVLADWTAYYIALQNGADPEQVPMVEEFKKML